MSPKIGMEKIRKQQIIVAAKECIVTKGLPHFSIKDIAKQANLSTGVIYHYFENKDDLLIDVLKDAFSITEQLVQEKVNKASNYEDKINAYLETVAKVPEENPDFYIILVNYLAQAPYHQQLKIVIQRFFENLGSFIEAILDVGYKEGVLKKKSKTIVPKLILSQAMGVAFYYLISDENSINKSQLNSEFTEIFKKYIE